MARRPKDAPIVDWDDERVALRVRMRLAEERGYAGEDQRDLSRKIAELDKKIAAARGGRNDG